MNSKSSHIGLWRYASTFYCAAIKLHKDGEINIVVYYLYSHAIELVLKAVLIFRNFQEKDLKKIGHDLIKVWNEAIEIEPNLANMIKDQEKLEAILALLNPYYRSKEFEYIKVGFKHFPSIKDVREIIEELLFVIGKIISIPYPELNKLKLNINNAK